MDCHDKMGNTSSYPAISAFYNPEFGIAFGANYNFKKQKPVYGLNVINEDDDIGRRPEGIVFRNRKIRRLSSEHSDRDSAIGGVSDLGQSFYSESGVNRDSFYSTCTAESGFENMPESWEDNTSVGGRYPFRFRHPSSSHSMNVNFSPKSLKEKHMRYMSENPPEGSSDSLHSLEILEKSSVLLTPPSDDEKSPTHVGHHSGSHVHGEKRSTSSEKGQSLSAEFDQIHDLAESLKSFSGGTNSIGDWSCDDDGEALSPVPHIHTSLSDYQFKQSVLQRLHEWSSLSSENFHSRPPTPDRAHGICVRRSQSLDRHISESYSLDNEIFENTTIDFEEKTTKNLELIEDELHDIQDEFNVITSKLGDLIRQGSDSSEKSQPESRTLADDLPLSPITTTIVQKTLSRWERSPSISLDSNRCSREGSVDLAWDLCELADGDQPSRLRSVRAHRLNKDSGHLSSPGGTSGVTDAPDDVSVKGTSEAADVCDVDPDNTIVNTSTVDSALPRDDLSVDSEPAEETLLHPKNIGIAF